jgi:hypothetical protein
MFSDVEPEADGVASWVEISPDARSGAAAVADVEHIYVRVRKDDGSTVQTFRLALSELPSAPDTAEYDLEVQLKGQYCPHTVN